MRQAHASRSRRSCSGDTTDEARYAAAWRRKTAARVGRSGSTCPSPEPSARGQGDTSFHPVTLTLVVGIGLQGLAECFLSPKFLEFASKQAPPGEVGLYMGYSSLTTFFAWLFGFVVSGYLLDAFCPDPRTLPAAVQQAHADALANGGALPEAYAHAHYIWYVFAVIGAVAFVCLLVYAWITARLDAARD